MSDVIVEDFDDDSPDTPKPVTRQLVRSVGRQEKERIPPANEKAEQHIIACCLLDEGFTLDRATTFGIKPDSFYFPRNRVLFTKLAEMREAKKPIAMDTLVVELQNSHQLEAVGGLPYLIQITSDIPTTAHATHMMEDVAAKKIRRSLISHATELIEKGYNGVSIDDLLSDAERVLKGLAPKTKRAEQKSLDQFKILQANDSSVLLGNRYLNRGDGIILSGSSGMGKSSMQTQMAVSWATGKDFMGIKSNGSLKSLIIQSEDSDGDIGEVWLSMKHMMNLSAAEEKMVNDNVRIVTDRTNRGTRFMSALKSHIEEFKPDLVWLNPLQAFIDGDVTESRDLGLFLREGLNGLNEPASFGYVIVHHTTKPSTGKDKTERLWHEVMYDMAGGAELINWARGIISLRASDVEGEFQLVLAKRGRRAGVVKQVEQGAGFRTEPVTVIGLRHSRGLIPDTNVPVIYWEQCEVTKIEQSSEKKSVAGKHSFDDFRSLFPPKKSPGMLIRPLHTLLIQNKDITAAALHACLKQWSDEGLVEVIRVPGFPDKYRSAL